MYCDDYTRMIINLADTYEQLWQAKLTEETALQIFENEILDLEHALEFYSLDAVRRAKVAKEITNLRIARRDAKDSMFMLGKIPLIDRGNVALNILQDLRSMALKAQEARCVRQYSPRSDVLFRLGIEPK